MCGRFLLTSARAASGATTDLDLRLLWSSLTCGRSADSVQRCSFYSTFWPFGPSLTYSSLLRSLWIYSSLVRSASVSKLASFCTSCVMMPCWWLYSSISLSAEFFPFVRACNFFRPSRSGNCGVTWLLDSREMLYLLVFYSIFAVELLIDSSLILIDSICLFRGS